MMLATLCHTLNGLGFRVLLLNHLVLGFLDSWLADRMGAMARREDELMLAGIIRTRGKAREWQAAAALSSYL